MPVRLGVDALLHSRVECEREAATDALQNQRGTRVGCPARDPPYVISDGVAAGPDRVSRCDER